MKQICLYNLNVVSLGLRLDKRIEEAAPAAQQLQELGRRLRCDDSSSEHVSSIVLLCVSTQFCQSSSKK